MVHGALDNNHPGGRCRLSSDTRYQLRDDQRDERWFGSVANPYGGDYERGKRVFYPDSSPAPMAIPSSRKSGSRWMKTAACS